MMLARPTLLRRLVVATTNSNSSSNSAAQAASRWASTLVVSEPLLVDGATPPGTQSTVTAANQLGQAVDLLVVGDVAPSKVPEGVTNVYHVPIGDRLAETVASAIQSVATSKDCSVVMGTSSKFGSTVIPRAAALLQVSPITDILQIQDESKNTVE
jgi:electron transfer flavoprotein alpha subunit